MGKWIGPADWPTSIEVRPLAPTPVREEAHWSEFVSALVVACERDREFVARCWNSMAPVVVLATFGLAPPTFTAVPYIELLMFHRSVHPEVKAILTRAMRQVAMDFEAPTQALVAASISSPHVVVERLYGLEALIPVGVCGVVRGPRGVVLCRRSDVVALNPARYSFLIDGGIDASDADPRAALLREAGEELPDTEVTYCEPLVWWVPDSSDTMRNGFGASNFLFEVALGADPKLLSNEADHLEWSGEADRAAWCQVVQEYVDAHEIVGSG